MRDSQEQLKLVTLSKPDPRWMDKFAEAANEIKNILQANCIAIHHIGSTAIPFVNQVVARRRRLTPKECIHKYMTEGKRRLQQRHNLIHEGYIPSILAKPIVDIMPVVKNIQLLDDLNHQFEALGYVCMGEYGMPGRRFYWKSKGKRTHNIHVFEQESPEVMRHLAFRDFMREHKNFAHAYSLIKQGLAEVFFDDITQYCEGKSSFIQMMDYKTGMASSAQLQAADNIAIVPYNWAWPKLAQAEIKTIQNVTADLLLDEIIHFGSTSIPELPSKPIIDLLITIPSLSDAEKWIEPLESLGYIFWKDNPNKSHFRFFKGMPPFGFRRTHHIHLVESSNPMIAKTILFRDILRQNKELRKKYELLKIELAQLYPNDRDAYTDQKSGFINDILRAAAI